MKKLNINHMIDHTNLKQDVISKDIDRLMAEADEYGFHSICISPVWVLYAKKRMEEKKYNFKICTVIGFSLGQNTTDTKAFEAKKAIEDGADELDFVANVSFIKEKNIDALENELRLIRSITRGYNIKLIIETSLLTNQEKILITDLIVKSDFDFVKTATGLAKGGATVEDIKLLHDIVGDDFGIKASGGIKTYNQALELVNAGATRIGTSNGIAIAKGKKGKENY